MKLFGGREARRIAALIEEAELLPFGAEEQGKLGEAIRRADAAGEEELAYRARMLLTPSAHMTGDTDTMIATFGWCVGKHDQDPARFPLDPGVHTDLLFQYKWMASRLASNSRFGRERIEGIHADMERRYREAGVGQTGVLQSRHEAALLLGDVEEAGRMIEIRRTLERDGYSHCEACERADDASYAQLRGDDAEAIRLWEEIIDQGLSCGEEPEYAEADILLALLRAGRGEEALAAHARSYRAARQNQDGFPIIARHLVFCAVTGNLARGLQILERDLPLLAQDPYVEHAHLEGIASAAVLLDALVDAGQGDTPVRSSDDPSLDLLLGPAQRPRTARELRDAAWSAADAIAARFDARNGNDHFAGRVAAKRALHEVRYDLPFGAPDFTPAVPQQAEPADAAGWFARARMHQHVEDAEGARAAAAAGLALGDPAVAPLLHRTLVQLALEEERTEAARAAQADRIAALAAAGQAEQAQLEERLGLIMLGAGGPGDLPALQQELDAARDPSTRADLHLTTASYLLEQADAVRAQDAQAARRAESDALAHAEAAAAVLPAEDPQHLAYAAGATRVEALIRLERGDEALAQIHEVIEDPRLAGFPVFRLLNQGAQVHGSLAEYAEGLVLADRMLADAVSAGSPGMIVLAAHLSGMLLSDLGREDEAIGRLEFALRHAERIEQPTTSLRYQLARIQLSAGRPAEALENLETVYLEERQQEAPPVALAETSLFLGRAAMGAEEPGMAYRAWSEATDLAVQGEAPGLAADAAISFANLLLRFGDDDALAAAERAVSLAEASEEATAVVAALHGRGRARIAAEDPAGMADLERAREVAIGAGESWAAADVLDTIGQVLLDRDDLAAGIPTLLRAADAFAAAGDPMAAARGEVLAARTLLAAQRAEEAAAILRTAHGRFEPGTGPSIGIGLELADVLEGLGRTAEAEELRAAAE